MADANIKKVRIPFSDLPPINSITEGYSVRYRILSEDKNRASHWSPVYLIQPDYTYISNNIEFNSGNQIANITWDPVIVLKNIKSVQDVTNKQLSTDIATLTTSSAHYMNVDDWVTINGVDSIFNGTYKISAVTTNTFSYYKNHENIASTPVSPIGTYITNAIVRNATGYDIWVRWDRNDGGDWIYTERIETSSISFPHASIYTINGAIQPSAPNRLSIEIYLKGYPISRADGAPGTPFLKVYRLLNQTI